MTITVANPIYDSVFKFLVEDERVARILISALLKKDVVAVDMRRHEYPNSTRNQISMFRIDFGATVREADGSTHLVLIELQKTWLETETLRFRQYLGAQYNNKENISDKGEKEGYAIPMVAVYLLGHRVGDILEPVLYVSHKAYDYNGREVTHGIPDNFVESLTHDSIIVQIPLLNGKLQNRLDKVLSVFDQSSRDSHDNHVLHIDEGLYEDDADMLYILHRLTVAAADANMRQDMNVEDEYFSALEDRDTALMVRDKHIEEQDKHIKEQNKHIEEQGLKINEQSKHIEEQSKHIEEQSKHIEEQSKLIENQSSLLKASIKKLHDLGLSSSEIAETLGKDLNDIRALM